METEIVLEKCGFVYNIKMAASVVVPGDFFLGGNCYWRVESVLEDGVWASDGQESAFFRFLS
jgi:hypothetical protein